MKRSTSASSTRSAYFCDSSSSNCCAISCLSALLGSVSLAGLLPVSEFTPPPFGFWISKLVIGLPSTLATTLSTESPYWPVFCGGGGKDDWLTGTGAYGDGPVATGLVRVHGILASLRLLLLQPQNPIANARSADRHPCAADKFQTYLQQALAGRAADSLALCGCSSLRWCLEAPA